MKLLNSKPMDEFSTNGQGIGIENVKKRLSLLYPGKHELTIQKEDDLFIVVLKLHLEKANVEAIHINSASFSPEMN